MTHKCYRIGGKVKIYFSALLILLFFSFGSSFSLAKGNDSVLEKYVDLGYVPGELLIRLEKDSPRLRPTFFKRLLGKSLDKEPVVLEDISTSNKQVEDLIVKAKNSGAVTIKKVYPKESFKNIPKKARGNFRNGFLDRYYKVEGGIYGEDLEDVAKDMESLDIVADASPNYIGKASVIPNDPYFSYQMSLNTDKYKDIDAPEAWDIYQGDSDVVVAVLDSGIDFEHEDLKDKIISDKAYDFVADYIYYDWYKCHLNPSLPVCSQIDFIPNDFFGHGTHVSGIIAASANNGKGIAGIDWKAKILPIGVLDAAGVTNCTIFGRGLFYLEELAYDGYRIDVINMSLGFSDGNQCPDVNYLMEFLDSYGITLVGASGNDGSSTPVYPAAYDEVIAVSATNPDDTKPSFSNYGPWVDISAPGVEVLSTAIQGAPACPGNNGYDYGVCSGTSMAAPHVSGLAALIKGMDPALSPSGIKKVLQDTSDTLPFSDMGAGRINMYEALRSLKRADISGRGWVDFNYNGLQDPEDSGLPGDSVYLYEGGGCLESSKVETKITDSDGSYAFKDVKVGHYSVGYDEDVFFETKQNVNDNNNDDRDSDGPCADISLVGDNISNVDFGFFSKGAISGHTWEVAYQGGARQDSGGWVVNIEGPEGYSSSFTTEWYGEYDFYNLVPGVYTVYETARKGWIQTQPVENGGKYTLTLVSGAHLYENDFYNLKLKPEVYIYKKINGIPDPRSGPVEVSVGDLVRYDFEIENTGREDLINISLSDPSLPDLSCPDIPETLGHGERATLDNCENSTVEALPGEVGNTASVTVEGVESGDTLTKESRTVYYRGVVDTPSISCGNVSVTASDIDGFETSQGKKGYYMLRAVVLSENYEVEKAKFEVGLPGGDVETYYCGNDPEADPNCIIVPSDINEYTLLYRNFNLTKSGVYSFKAYVWDGSDWID